MLNNKARIMVLSLLLSGCGGAGGSFSSASVSNSAQIITRTYQLNHGSGDWFSSKWAYIDGETSVGKVYQDSSMSPDQDTSDQLIKVIIADDAPSVPKQVTIKKDTDFSFKIPSLAIAKGNKLTLAGTKDSSVGIDVLALQGELIVSSGKIDLTGNIEVSQEGVIRDETAAKDGVVFSASSAQKGKVILDGTFDGNLTLPENFTLKTSLGGRITGDLVSDGILELVAGKTLNVGGVFTNNGDVIIDLSGQSPSKTPLLKSAGDINLRSGGITVKGGKKGIYAIFETDGKIVSKSDNLAVNNGEVVIQTSQTYSLDIKNPSAKFMEGQFHKFNFNGAVNDYVAFLRTSLVLDANMNHERIYDLSVVSKSQDRKIFYGVNYKGNFGLYVDYAREGYLNAGIYNLTSFYGFDFINALHSMSCRMTDNDISQKMQSHFFEVDSSLSRKVNISKQIDVIPHFSLTYSKILALDGGFVHENRLFEVQANQKAGFYVKAGIDAVSKMNIKSIDCEAFVTVDVSNKGYDRISFVSGDIEIAGRSEFLPSISMGVNTKFSQDSKMYARTKIHFEKSLFEVGLNIKI